MSTAVAAGAGLSDPKSLLIVAGAPAVSTAMTVVLGDVSARIVSARERMRMGAVGVMALQLIRKRLAEGDTPRRDGFFDERTPHRSRANELLEGVLLKARDQYEEKKLPFLANLIANAVFDSVEPGTLMWAVSLGGVINYRQFVVLALFRDDLARQALRAQEGLYIVPSTSKLEDQASLLAEIFDLYQRSLVAKAEREPGKFLVLLGPGNVAPRFMILTYPFGIRLHALLGLQGVDTADKDEVATMLR